MNRMYNQTPYRQFAPNQIPVQQPQSPYQTNYFQNNPQQMPSPYPPQQPYQPIANYRQYPNQPSPQLYRMPAGQGFNGPPPQEEKKGFLSKLFRNSNKQPPAQTAQSLFSLPPNSTRSASAASAATTAAGSGGLLQSLVNPANLTSMLNNTQKVLQAAESIGPLVQQYGPMVKNIPSVWKTIQGFTSKENEQPSENTPQNSNIAPVKIVDQTIHTHNTVQEPIHHQAHIKPPSPVKRRPNRQYAPGESIPRLFV